MKVRPAFLLLPALGALSQPLIAEDLKHYSYQSTARAQSADEVEDLGEIAASPEAGAAAAEGKEVAPPVPVKSKFRFNVTTRGEFTSNAKLSGDHSSGDVIFLPTIEGGYHTPLGKYFTFDLATKVESGIYAENNDRGFVGYSANATLDFRPRPKLPRIYITAEPYRYDGFDTGDMITQAIGLTAGTDWGFAFNNGRSLAFVGYSYGHYFADPNIDDRNSHRIVGGVAHQLRQNLTGQVYYAWQYNDFNSFSRHDSRNFVGANLVYQFSERIFGSFTSTFVDNDSSVESASYQSVTASLGLTISL